MVIEGEHTFIEEGVVTVTVTEMKEDIIEVHTSIKVVVVAMGSTGEEIISSVIPSIFV